MNKFYCDNCGCEMQNENERYLWFKSFLWGNAEHYKVDLCDECYYRIIKHLRRLVYKYKNSSRRI